MTWFKVDDHLHSHSKAMRAGTEAMGLWVLAGSWSAAEESDGWVPDYVLPRLAGANAEELAQRLCRAGLWLPLTDAETEERGYQFHGWEEFQPTRAQLDAKRADARERMRRARAQGGDVRANSDGTSRAVTPTPTRPDPTNNNTSAAGAADPDDFAAFWAACPRKIGKAAAAKAYAKARKGADADAILRGLENAKAVWRADRTEERFIPHPATWLNQGRWADEHPQLPGTPEAQQRPATAMQCASTEPHGRHPWEDARNQYVCMGETA